MRPRGAVPIRRRPAFRQRIARAMGSRIEVHSVPGEGARFGLSLYCPVVALSASALSGDAERWLPAATAVAS